MTSMESSSPPSTPEPFADLTRSDKPGPSQNKRSAESLENVPAAKRQKVVRFRPDHSLQNSKDPRKVDASMSAPISSDQASQAPFDNRLPACKLLVNYTDSRLSNLSDSMDRFSNDFASAIRSRFDIATSSDCGSYIEPCHMHNARAEWERAYRQEKRIDVTTSHSNLKVKSIKHAHLAITVKEDCRYKRELVSMDQYFFEEWKRRWEGAIVREAGNMFDQMIEFFEAQEKALAKTGEAMYHAMTPWMSRMK